MARKNTVIFITVVMAIFIFTTITFVRNPQYRQDERWQARKTETLVALEVKNELSGSLEKPYYVPILMYHSINDQPIGIPELSVKIKDFEAQMQYLADNGYTVIGFDELHNAGQYEKPIILTFDDGYEDNYTNAYPILKKYHFRATFFIISGLIDSPGYLTATEISEMTDIISFQSHTVDHKPLSTLSKEETQKELSVSKDTIQKLTNEKVDVIAYPSGDFNDTTLKIAAKDYDYAVTTEFGYYFSVSQRYEIKRLAVSRFENLKQFIFYIQ